jgi:drug/metabolite transporter (DMT)-like permease
MTAVFLAAAGVFVLFRPIGLEWRRGDTWTFLCALAFAYYIVELGRMSRLFNVADLVLVQCLTLAVLAALLAPLLESPHVEAGWPALGIVVYLGIACTALTFFLMTWGQARLGAIEAAVIYTMEPVFAACFSIALGRELATMKLLVGGGLIVTAMLLSSTGRAESDPEA